MAGWLSLDVGNSQAKAAVFDRDTGETLASARFDWLDLGDELDWASAVSGSLPHFERAVVACGVHPVRPLLERALGPAIFVNHDTRRDFQLNRPHPERIGSDRLANIAGALALHAGPLLIVDAGTATTFSLVDATPAHIGGVITAGLETSYEALLDGAPALLKNAPRARLRDDDAEGIRLRRPESALGRDTHEQLASGAILAHELMIEAMAARLCQQAGGDFSHARWILTGGCAHWMQLGARFEVVPDLTLRGLFRYGQLTA